MNTRDTVREIPLKSHNFILYFSNPFVSEYGYDYQIDTNKKVAKLATLSVWLLLLTKYRTSTFDFQLVISFTTLYRARNILFLSINFRQEILKFPCEVHLFFLHLIQ